MSLLVGACGEGAEPAADATPLPDAAPPLQLVRESSVTVPLDTSMTYWYAHVTTRGDELVLLGGGEVVVLDADVVEHARASHTNPDRFLGGAMALSDGSFAVVQQGEDPTLYRLTPELGSIDQITLPVSGFYPTVYSMAVDDERLYVRTGSPGNAVLHMLDAAGELTSEPIDGAMSSANRYGVQTGPGEVVLCGTGGSDVRLRRFSSEGAGEHLVLAVASANDCALTRAGDHLVGMWQIRQGTFSPPKELHAAMADASGTTLASYAKQAVGRRVGQLRGIASIGDLAIALTDTHEDDAAGHLLWVFDTNSGTWRLPFDIADTRSVLGMTAIGHSLYIVWSTEPTRVTVEKYSLQ